MRERGREKRKKMSLVGEYHGGDNKWEPKQTVAERGRCQRHMCAAQCGCGCMCNMVCV